MDDVKGDETGGTDYFAYGSNMDTEQMSERYLDGNRETQVGNSHKGRERENDIAATKDYNQVSTM